jgi:hypothetical protein
LDVAIKEVERAGGSLVSRGEHMPGAPFAYVADPEGYVIELETWAPEGFRSDGSRRSKAQPITHRENASRITAR